MLQQVSTFRICPYVLVTTSQKEYGQISGVFILKCEREMLNAEKVCTVMDAKHGPYWLQYTNSGSNALH